MNFVHEQHFRGCVGGSDGAATTCHLYVPEERALFTGLSDGKIAWWRRRKGSGRAQAEDEPCFLEGHGGVVRCLATIDLTAFGRAGTLVASGSADRTIRVWDPWVRDSRKACVQTLRAHEGSVSALACHARLLLSCGTDRSLRLWQMDGGRELLLYPWFSLLETVGGHGCWLSALALHVVGESGEVYAADERGGVCAYGLTMRSRQVSLSQAAQHPDLHALGITDLLLAPADGLLFTLSYDQTARAHKAASGAPVLCVRNPRAVRFTAMAWHAAERELLLADELGHVLVWSVRAERCVVDAPLLARPPKGPAAGVACGFGSVSLSGCGGELLGTEPRGCRAWRVVRDLGYAEVGGHTGAVIGLQAAEGAGPSECRLFSASVDNSVRCWDGPALSCAAVLTEPGSEVSCLLHCEARALLISGNDDGSIRLWNAASGSSVCLPAHGNTVTCLALGARGRSDLLLSGSFDGCLAVWQLPKRKHAPPQIETIFRAHAPAEILCLAFNPRNGSAVSGGNGGLLRVWSVATYEQIAQLRGHTDAVTALALDGNFLLSGSEDGTVRVWDSHAHSPLQTLAAHSGCVGQLLVLPESGWLVSGCRGCLRVWQYAEQRLLHEWSHPDAIRSLALMVGLRKLACGTEGHAIVLFPLDQVYEAEAERARALAAESAALTAAPADEGAPASDDATAL